MKLLLPIAAFALMGVACSGETAPATPAPAPVAEAPAPATIEQILGRRAAQDVDPVAGPQVVVREDCTIWVPDGWTGRPGPLGSLVLTRSEAGS